MPELQKLMGTELNMNSTVKHKRASRSHIKSDNSAAETKKKKSKDIQKGENSVNVAKKLEKSKTKIVQNGDFNGEFINDPSKKRGAVERITRQRKRPTN